MCFSKTKKKVRKVIKLYILWYTVIIKRAYNLPVYVYIEEVEGKIDNNK